MKSKTLGTLRSQILGGEALSLSEQIATQLAESIAQGDYDPGDRIHEVAVSERFQVSRGPVREALRILEKKGLVSIQPRRGAIVTKLSIEEVEDVFEIRATLLGLAGRRAALMGDESLNAELREKIAELTALLDLGEGEDVTDAYLAKVQDLNLNLCIGTGSARLVEMIFSLLHQTIRYSRLGLSTRARRAQSLRNWTRLVEYIEAGDGDGAEDATRKLVNRSKDMAVKILREGSEAHKPD